MPDEERLQDLSETVAQLLRRQRELEVRIRFLEARNGLTAPEHTEPPPLPHIVVPEPPPALPIPIPPPLLMRELPPADHEGVALETTVGLNWINRIGVITLILGAAFLFKYGIDNGWIGPEVRVILGVIAALVSLVSGNVLRRRGHVVFAQGITGLGLSLFYLSFYAAATLYHLIPPAIAFILMCAVTAGAARLALLYEAPAIAALGMIGGYITPVALSTGEDRPWILFIYLVILNTGELVLLRFRQWKPLEFLALGATTALYAGCYAAWFGDANRPVATVFAIVFYFQFIFAQPAVWAAAQFLAPLALGAIWTASGRFLPWELVFVAAGLAVAQLREWKGAPLWTLLCYWLPVGMWLANPGPFEVVFAFEFLTAAFVAFFLWIPWRARNSETLRETEAALMTCNAALYFTASYYLLNPLHHGYMGLLAVTVGALHFLLGWGLRKSETGLLATGVALAFITLAIPIQFTSFRVTVAWALEGAALAWISAKFGAKWFREGAIAVLVLTLVRLLAFDLWIYTKSTEYDTLSNSRFLTFAVVTAALWLTARFLSNAAAYVAGHAVLLLGLGLEIGGWVGRNTPVDDQSSIQIVAISILMTVYAVILVVLGVATRTTLNRLLGLGLIGIVMAKLYLVDVWVVGRGFRITAFLALGVLLLLVSFLYSRFKPALERLLKSDSPSKA